VVVELPEPLRERNSTESQQSGHILWSRPEIKNERRNDEDGAPKRFRCEIIRKEVS